MEVHKGLLSHSAPERRKVALVDAPGVSLRTALSTNNISRNTRLALILIVASSFGQFYVSNWMRQPWTHDSIYFLQEYGHDDDEQQIHAQRPHLSTFFDPADEIYNPFGRLHKRPNILALGILMLEIELGLDLQNERKAKDLKPNGDPTSNTDLFTALDILADKPRWDKRRRFPVVKDVIETCLEDRFNQCSNQTEERDAIYKKVIAPLERTWEVVTRIPLEDLDTAYPPSLNAMEPKSTLSSNNSKRPVRDLHARHLTTAGVQLSQVTNPPM